MGFEVHLVDGRPAKITGDTPEELRAALGIAASVGLLGQGPRTASRSKATRRKVGTRSRRGGWTPEVYALAKSAGITPTEARAKIAARKTTTAAKGGKAK